MNFFPENFNTVVDAFFVNNSGWHLTSQNPSRKAIVIRIDSLIVQVLVIRNELIYSAEPLLSTEVVTPHPYLPSSQSTVFSLHSASITLVWRMSTHYSLHKRVNAFMLCDKDEWPLQMWREYKDAK